MDKVKISQELRDKRILITGGTGSFGKEILGELFQYAPAEIRVLSRDEKKQWDMGFLFPNQPTLRFCLGDVRDYFSVLDAMRGVDIVFHAAALKQVPNCEKAPYEAVLTNVIGAENVRRAALELDVETVVAISTDKAVKPVNVMGMSKAMQERIMLNPRPGYNGRTKFVCVRYGNVLGSRGSVVPLFADQIAKGVPLTITHPEMTRFQLTLNEAVQLVMWATVKGENGDLWVRKMPAAKVIDLARALASGITGRADYPINNIGTRPGEKMHEVLVSEEEMWRATELGDHFLIPTWAYSSEKEGIKEGLFTEYSSAGVHLLSDNEIKQLLIGDGWVAKTGGPGPKAMRGSCE